MDVIAWYLSDFSIFAFVVFIFAFIGAFRFKDDFPLIGFFTGLIVSGACCLLFVILFSSTEEEHYVSEEHSLVAVGNDSAISGSATGNIFVSSARVGEKNVFKFIREDKDDQGRTFNTVVEQDADKTRIYQDSKQRPVERHHSTKKIMRNPLTGETKDAGSELDYVEVIVPKGSVVQDYKVDVTQGSTSK